MQVKLVSVFEIAVPISIAEAKSLTVFHLYPVAPETAFQFHTICATAGTLVPAVGAAGGFSKVVWVRVTELEFPQAL